MNRSLNNYLFHVKEEIKRDLAYYKNNLKHLEDIKFKTKKDGGLFADLKKNLDCDHVSLEINGATLAIKVYTWDANLGYNYFWIHSKNPSGKIENDIDKIYLSVADIKQAIKAEIEYTKNKIESLEKQLAIHEEVITKYFNFTNNLINEVRSNAGVQDGETYGNKLSNEIKLMINDMIQLSF